MYLYWDPTYILVIVGAIICMIASARVKTTFNKYSRYRSMSGMTGAQAAQRILNSAGIYDVRVQHISGNLTDHYNPANKTLNLSDSVYGSTSVAAVGVAAHECGHAIQHQKEYLPLKIRSALVPAANFGSALRILGETGILNSQELPYTKKVLGAAALTYVASAAAAILQLLRIILLFGGRGNDRD